MTTVNPYLVFNDNCEEVFNFYKSCFGSEFSAIMRFKDVPGSHQNEIENERIMHISLPIGNTVLMGSDNSSLMDPVKIGNNISVSIQTETEEETNQVYNALSAGGIITMPLNKSPWNALFGMFIDKFGVHWLINCDLNEKK